MFGEGIHNFWLRLKLVFRRRQLERDLDDELKFHLAMREQKLREQGVAAEEAPYAARRQFGNATLLKETSRELWGFRSIETFAQDLRYGLRQLKRNPGFTAVAVITLALGIGVNVAIFSLVDQLLLWSIPAREPSRLVKLEGMYSKAYPFYCAYRDHNQVFSSVFASSNHLAVGIRPESAPAIEVGHVDYVSGSYFQTLGIGSAAGRVIAPPDDTTVGGSPIAVLSYGYWRRRFAGDLKIIGRKLAVNGYPLEIVGIAEKGFGGLSNGEEADAFIPLTMFPVTTPSAARAWNTPHMYWLVTMARLKPGISFQQAQAGMQVLWAQAVEAVNDAAVKAGGKARKFREDQIKLVPGARAGSFSRGGMFDPLAALALATCLVLLIACANVANLLLSRATGRRKEIALRLAVGATRGRLIRQLLTESLVLAAAGGTLGLALAYFGVAALAKTKVIDPSLHFRPSLIVLAFSVGIMVLTGILFGLVPAFEATRMTLTESVKEGGAATQGGSRMRLGKALIAVQVALSLALLIGASLFIRTLRNLQNVNLGFQREKIAIFDIDPTNLGYRGQPLRGFYDQILERARGVPGIGSAALSAMTPLGNYMRSFTFSAEGYQPKSGERLFAITNPVTSGYFTTLGIPLLLGRDFRPEDEPAVTPGESLIAAMGRSGGGTNEAPANASRICIIDESLARHLFADANPLGRHLSFEDVYTVDKSLEIVGVVKDAHYGSVRNSDQEGTVYQPSWSNGAEVRWLVVRFAGSAAPVIAGIRRQLREMDPNVPVLRVRTMDEYLNDALARERLIVCLSGFFGILALGFASVGLYGVMAYAVTRRTREVGIRMALGAQRRDVVRMIMGESLVPVLIGMGIGLVGALALIRLVASLLYGVAPSDPGSIVLAVAAMLAVSLLAAAIPARRATKVEPTVALRYE
jgi:predicted permease